MNQRTDLELSSDRAGLALVDWQERLWPAMPGAARELALRNGLILIEAARRLGLPVVVSEQYPKGLGRTIPELAAALEGLPRLVRFEKLEFGCVGCEPFDR